MTMKLRLSSQVLYIIIALLIVIIMVTMTDFYSRRPVMVGWKHTVISQNENEISMNVSAYKARSCRRLKNSERGFVLAADDVLYEVEFELVERIPNPTMGKSKSKYRQDLGAFRWSWSDDEIELPAKGVQMITQHDCNGLLIQTKTPFLEL